MRIFVAGATGAVGKRLVPLLVASGHEVTGMTRSPEKSAPLLSAGAQPVVVDALDRDAVMAAVTSAEPEVVVHQLTAIPPNADPRRFDREFERTNRLRREGTDHLLEAARSAGTRRFVAQSFAGWPYAREGGAVKTEEDPLDPDPPRAMSRTLEAIRHLEAGVAEAEELEGLVLRYGVFYGPGTSIGPGGAHVEMVRRRLFPLVGTAAGVWSFIHIDDAATATLAAIEHGAPGIYNIVDDEPATVAEWLPVLAAAIDAPQPRRLPTWVARLAVGEVGVSLMTRVRGASNAKAKRELGWRPAYGTWREGFRTGLDG